MEGMNGMSEAIDLTACIAKGQVIKVDGKEYEIKFTYRALHALEEIYGNVGAALDSFIERRKIYDDTLNFLYASLGEKYKQNKTDIEQWITLSSVHILYSIIFDMIMSSFGESEGEPQGEA